MFIESSFKFPRNPSGRHGQTHPPRPPVHCEVQSHNKRGSYHRQQSNRRGGSGSCLSNHRSSQKYDKARDGLKLKCRK